MFYVLELIPKAMQGKESMTMDIVWTALAIFLGPFSGFFISFIVLDLVSLIRGKLHGYYVRGFSFLGINYTRVIQEEEFAKRKVEFSLIPKIFMTQKLPMDTKKDGIHEKINAFFLLGINLLISAIIFYYVIIPVMGGKTEFGIERDEYVNVVLYPAIIIGMLVIFSIFYLSTVFHVTSGENSLLSREYCDEMKKLRNGFSFDYLSVASERVCGVEAIDGIKIAYLTMCFCKALYIKDTNQMDGTVRFLEYLLSKNTSDVTKMSCNESYIGAYYAVLLYYSYICPEEKATRYYDDIKESIEADTDYNARVILAFYNRNILGRSDVAARFINQAKEHLMVADERKFVHAHQELYRELINEFENYSDTVDQMSQSVIKEVFSEKYR